MGRPREQQFNIGQMFGEVQLVAIKANKKDTQEKYKLRCVCGREWWKTRPAMRLAPEALCRSCAGKEGRKDRDGRSTTKTYRVWLAMLDRCYVPDHHAYLRYGGRGITVCKRWRNYDNFLSDMGEKPEGRSIERINNERGYMPSNCRWATPREQNSNQRTNRWLVANGERLHMAEWARRLNTKPTTIWLRLCAGWPEQDACTTPVKVYKKRKSE
jgi:hypothetical protein